MTTRRLDDDDATTTTTSERRARAMGASARRKARRAVRWGVRDDARASRGTIDARVDARDGGARERDERGERATPARARGRASADVDDDARAVWRECVVRVMGAMDGAVDATGVTAALRNGGARGTEAETMVIERAIEVGTLEREVLETLMDLRARGLVESLDDALPVSQRERLAFRKRFALAKGVAASMRAMTGAEASTSDVSDSDDGEGERERGDEVFSGADGERVQASESEDDDHHDFDDSFDEYTDDEEHNFSYNVEEHGDSDSNSDAHGDADESLHGQIVDFVRRNEMSHHEESRRQHVFEAIERAITRQYASHKNCSLHVFGSGATGLALAGADLDLVILGVGPQSRKGGGGGFTRSEREEIVQHLRKMARFLRQANAVSRAEVIATAKVPIVKMKSASPPYIAVDLSLGTTNGLEAVYWIREQVDKYKALRPLVFYLKRLLATHHLNDAATGGCGGYLLVSLVVSHLKQTGTAVAVNRPGVLGDLLLGFLRRFGMVFDYKTTAVAAGRESGVMSVAELPGPPFGVRPYIMAEDPQERMRCFTAAAYRFREVQNLFRLAAEHITVSGELSLLSDVAAPNPRAGMFKGGQVIKVRQGAVNQGQSRRPNDAKPSTSKKKGGKSNHHLFRKANAKNSFSESKKDWTDEPRNYKRPRGASAWSSDGHKGHGGEPTNPKKRRRLAATAPSGKAKKGQPSPTPPKRGAKKRAR